MLVRFGHWLGTLPWDSPFNLPDQILEQGEIAFPGYGLEPAVRRRLSDALIGRPGRSAERILISGRQPAHIKMGVEFHSRQVVGQPVCKLAVPALYEYDGDIRHQVSQSPTRAAEADSVRNNQDAHECSRAAYISMHKKTAGPKRLPVENLSY